MVTIDPVPDWFRDAGHAVFDRREPSVKVADLAFDSLGTPSGATPRWRVLWFVGERHTVAARVTDEGEGTVQLDVTVWPRRRLRLDVRSLHAEVRRFWTDANGFAACPAIPTGPASLLVHWPEDAGGAVRTAWVQL